ncbi:MAG: carboxypeptidase regulatory-like domain-containing protein [Proteobacteria bacterium]|nr:carboxypeptidase regulatory-like domain-containing protein [Pseudomonadota bacterium]
MKPSTLLKIGIPILVLGGLGAGAYFVLSPPETEVLPDESGGFSGIVVNGVDGAPLSNVQIAVLSTHNNKIVAQTTSNEKGRFALILEDGEYIIQPSMDHYISRGKDDTGRTIRIKDSTQYVNAKLRLWPASSLQGRIVAGNVGIQAHVNIEYTRDASGASPYTFATLDTEKDGTFSVTDAYAGVMSVSVTSEGFANVALRDIIIKAGQDVDLGDIPMRDGVSLFGKITDDATQKGISGAAIVIKDGESNILEQTQTDSNGDYRLPALDMMRVRMEISATGYHDVNQTMQLKGNTNREISLSLKRAWGLVLDVQNLTNREPLTTEVTIKDVLTNKIVYDQILSNGVYSLDSLKGGPFLIEAYSNDRKASHTLRVSAGEEAKIRLKPFGIIHMKVFESDGTPLTTGEFRYSYRPFKTEDTSYKAWAAITSSEFDIPDLVEGHYWVEIRKDNSQKEIASPEFSIYNGDVRPLTMQLTEGGVLKGHVVSTEDALNVQATVTLETDSRSVKTDSDGNFVIDKFPEGSAAIVIKPDGESTEARFENIVVKENATVEREFRVDAPKLERRTNRQNRMKEMHEQMREHRRDGTFQWKDGERPTPPWGDGPPPWGDGPPPWENGKMPNPPWGDGPPPWENGNMPNPRETGEMPTPPWGDGPPPWEDRLQRRTDRPAHGDNPDNAHETHEPPPDAPGVKE